MEAVVAVLVEIDSLIDSVAVQEKVAVQGVADVPQVDDEEVQAKKGVAPAGDAEIEAEAVATENAVEAEAVDVVVAATGAAETRTRKGKTGTKRANPGQENLRIKKKTKRAEKREDAIEVPVAAADFASV